MRVALVALTLGLAASSAHANTAPAPAPAPHAGDGASTTSHSAVDALKAFLNAKSLYEATPGQKKMAQLYAIDAAAHAALRPGCDPATRPPQPDAYAFLGSGNLLPYYQGVVQALQDRGVLTADVMKHARFAGFSGGSLTAVLTGLGWPGAKQYALYKSIFTKVGQCADKATSAADKLKCTLNGVGIPLVRDELAGTNVPAIINGRITLWACQVNPMGKTLNGSVAQSMSSWTSNDDVLANVMVSDQIPCITTDTFYNIFRDAPFIDGGYCTDFEQLCPKDAADCLRVSSEFLGPALPAGTPFPTDKNCPYAPPLDHRPNLGHYVTPTNRSTWTLPQGSCLNDTDKAAVNITPRHVPQGATARPDIHPAFYAPLPAEFADGCEWIKTALVPLPGRDGSYNAGLDATYNHGYASGAGWADQHGFCEGRVV